MVNKRGFSVVQNVLPSCKGKNAERYNFEEQMRYICLRKKIKLGLRTNNNGNCHTINAI